MDVKNYQMPISEFSLITGISKDNLRFYDKIGLLSPEIRGENNYRYYTDRQIDLAYLISDLRALGIGLEEIKRYADERSPERMITFFHEQNARIAKEIERLRLLQELMQLRSDMATKALMYEENVVQLEEKLAEPIFLCPPLAAGQSEADGLTASYNAAAAHDINLAFPIGGIIPQHNLKLGEWNNPAQYYFKVRKNHNAVKKAGTYAFFYCCMANIQEERLRNLLFAFLEEHNLKMQGDLYGEYHLDELVMHGWENYKIRIEVLVVQK